MRKIAMIGAGSVIFTRNVMGDTLSVPELGDSEIALMDIDPERLSVAETMVRRMADYLGVKPKITAHTDRREALDGANYIVNAIQVAGYKPGTVIDFEVPKKYGLKQTIADTIGIGGIFRALRTIPVLMSICKDIEELCPDAWVLNYSNPMAMNTGAMLKGSKVKVVGLCHGIQGSAASIARYLDIPVEEMAFTAAGVNHIAFFLKIMHNGVDMYPKLKEFGAKSEEDTVRFEVMKRLGYFGGEGSIHLAEYVPYFIRRDRPDLIEKFNIPIDEYMRRCVVQNESWDELAKQLSESDEPLEVKTRSHEYASHIIEAMETGRPCVIHGNVLNRGLITNLPDRCCVETPCLVNRNGVQPTIIGDLPPQVAGIIRTNVNVQELVIEAALTGNREHVYHAAMLDPHTCAELTLDEIWSLVDDMFDAHGEWIPPMGEAAVS